MTANVADNALLLEVLAGPDGLDPRQVNVKTAQYTNALTGDARGMKIAIVKEGFGHANSETDVDAVVRKGAALFRQLGAQVDEVSIPLHLAGPAIWTPIAAEGDAQPQAGRAAHGDDPAGVRDAAEHRAHRRDRTPVDERALRDERRPAGGHDADREALRRGRDLPRRLGVREGGRLEEPAPVA